MYMFVDRVCICVCVCVSVYVCMYLLGLVPVIGSFSDSFPRVFAEEATGEEPAAAEEGLWGAAAAAAAATTTKPGTALRASLLASVAEEVAHAQRLQTAIHLLEAAERLPRQ